MVVSSSAVRCCSTVAEENRTTDVVSEGSDGTGGVCRACSLHPWLVLMHDVFGGSVCSTTLRMMLFVFPGQSKGRRFFGVSPWWPG